MSVKFTGRLRKRYFVAGFGAAVLCLMLSGFSGATDWRANAVSLIKEEQSVIDALFSQPSILWVSMRDDGSRRDGFADYLCLLLTDAGMPTGASVTIRIWDANAMAREELKEIGKGRCLKG